MNPDNPTSSATHDYAYFGGYPGDCMEDYDRKIPWELIGDFTSVDNAIDLMRRTIESGCIGTFFVGETCILQNGPWTSVNALGLEEPLRVSPLGLEYEIEGFMDEAAHMVAIHGSFGTEPQPVVDDYVTLTQDALASWQSTLLARTSSTGPEGATALTVIGDDGRYRIRSTTAYPWRAIGHILTDLGRCTGFLINANTVATAGHCVHEGVTADGIKGRWASIGSTQFIPGRDGPSEPYGRCGAVNLYSVTGWTDHGHSRSDYGAIKLNCTIGTRVGTIGIYSEGSDADGFGVNVTGFPTDKGEGTMWNGRGYVKNDKARHWTYDADTTAGQSGAPVWHYRPECSFACAGAIHTKSAGTEVSWIYNAGTEIVPPVLANFEYWMSRQR